MSARRLHVIVGATGGTGSAILRELVARGEQVRAVGRRVPRELPAGVEWMHGEATDAASMREVAAGAAVIYNCVNPPFAQWRELFPRVNEALIAGAGRAGATLVFADDTWMYGRPAGPLTEEHPQRPAGPKGALRAELADSLLAAHHRGTVRVVIGRASELYGPGVESLLGVNLFRAAIRGGRAMWPGSLDAALNPTFIDDFARALITLGGHEAALGQAWHIPTPEPITGRAFTRLLFGEAGAPVKVAAVPRLLVRVLGLVWPVAREGAELLYQFEAPYIVDASKYRRVFGGAATPYQEGIRKTLEWYRAEAERQPAHQQTHWWREVWRYGHQR